MKRMHPPTAHSYPYITSSVTHVALVLDDIINPGFLYARDRMGNIHVIIDRAGAAKYAGVISTLGVSGNRAMTERLLGEDQPRSR